MSTIVSLLFMLMGYVAGFK